MLLLKNTLTDYQHATRNLSLVVVVFELNQLPLGISSGIAKEPYY
jgi:hypothetical protein